MKKGFTLVELLVVVSILLISVGIAGDLIITVIRSYNKTKILNEIEQNGNYAMAKIAYDLRNAKTINGAVGPASISIVDVNDQQITYTVGSVSAVNPSTITTGVISRTLGGVSEYMTSNDATEGVNVVCSGSCFSEVSTDPETIKIDFTISQGPSALGGASSAMQTFSTVVVLNSIFQ